MPDEKKHSATMLTPVQIKSADDMWGKEEDGHFPIFTRDEPVMDGEAVMKVSQWKPTAKQLKELNEGASIFLGIVCHAHPPIMLTVADVPPEEPEDRSNVIPIG